MKPALKEASANRNSGSTAMNGTASSASEAAREVSDREQERELVQRAQAGDQAAFHLLFERYHRRAYAVALGVVKNQQDALDVVQDAFIKVHKHIHNFQGSSSFYTWLYRIVMNLSIDHIRKRRKVTEFDDRIKKDEAVGGGRMMPKLTHENPSKNVSRQELSARIQDALAQLPEYHRAVILLREVEGLSYEEMAQTLEVPKGTIMSRLFHARRKMQVLLEDYVGGDFEVVE